MQHDLAVVPVHKHEDGYGCLITTNPETERADRHRQALTTRHTHEDVLTDRQFELPLEACRAFQRHTTSKRDSSVSSQADSGFGPARSLSSENASRIRGAGVADAVGSLVSCARATRPQDSETFRYANEHHTNACHRVTGVRF